MYNIDENYKIVSDFSVRVEFFVLFYIRFQKNVIRYESVNRMTALSDTSTLITSLIAFPVLPDRTQENQPHYLIYTSRIFIEIYRIIPFNLLHNFSQFSSI